MEISAWIIIPTVIMGGLPLFTDIKRQSYTGNNFLKKLSWAGYVTILCGIAIIVLTIVDSRKQTRERKNAEAERIKAEKEISSVMRQDINSSLKEFHLEYKNGVVIRKDTTIINNIIQPKESSNEKDIKLAEHPNIDICDGDTLTPTIAKTTTKDSYLIKIDICPFGDALAYNTHGTTALMKRVGNFIRTIGVNKEHNLNPSQSLSKGRKITTTPSLILEDMYEYFLLLRVDFTDRYNNQQPPLKRIYRIVKNPSIDGKDFATINDVSNTDYIKIKQYLISQKIW